MQALVRTAVARYVQSGLETDVSTALNRLFTNDLRPKADPVIFSPANAFRAHCYTEEVDDVLRLHEDALRLIYTAICNLKPMSMELGGMANLLFTHSDWLDFLRIFKLVDLDVTDNDGTLCFCWGKMVTINEQNPKDRIKLTHASFEDFLEALCRLAAMKGLPTDKEIANQAAEDGEPDGNAGIFLLKLADVPADYDTFLQERHTEWGKLPTAQPLARCVDHLCEVLIVFCQGGKERTNRDGLKLTQKQVNNTFKGKS